MNEEKTNFSGKYKIIARNKKTKKITKIVNFNNRLLDAYFTQILKALNSEDVSNANMKIKYLAIGTGTTAISDSDTTLDTEVFRCQYTNQYENSLGQLITEFVITDTDYAGTIQEWGIFAGSSASSTPNSGTLISRVLLEFEKLATEEINIIRTDTLSRI